MFSNGFVLPRWCLARFLSCDAGTNPPVSDYETRPLEPCAEIATAEAAMADEDPKGGGGSVFKLLLDDQKISEVLRTIIICIFCAMTRGFIVSSSTK